MVTLGFTDRYKNDLFYMEQDGRKLPLFGTFRCIFRGTCFMKASESSIRNCERYKELKKECGSRLLTDAELERLLGISQIFIKHTIDESIFLFVAHVIDEISP